MKKGFTDSLTPGQVQMVLDVLGLHWRDYEPNDQGWVDLPTAGSLNSDLGINIYHGGFVEQDSVHESGSKSKGDLVTLVERLRERPNGEAITFIKNATGIYKGKPPPELEGGYHFANEWLENRNYVRLPKDIMQSKLSGNEKIVWAAIFDRSGSDCIYAHPGTRRIAKDTGLSRPTVLKALEHLVKYGLIIEKPMGQNKSPQRYPLVAPVSVINQKVGSAGKEALPATTGQGSLPATGQNPLPPLVKNLNGAGQRSLPKLDTGTKPIITKPSNYTGGIVASTDPPGTDELSFDFFWAEYGKPAGRIDEAKKAWNVLTIEEKTAAIKFLPKYKEYRDAEYRKNPVNFLSDREWEDEFLKQQLDKGRGKILTYTEAYGLFLNNKLNGTNGAGGHDFDEIFEQVSGEGKNRKFKLRPGKEKLIKNWNFKW